MSTTSSGSSAAVRFWTTLTTVRFWTTLTTTGSDSSSLDKSSGFTDEPTTRGASGPAFGLIPSLAWLFATRLSKNTASSPTGPLKSLATARWFTPAPKWGGTNLMSTGATVGHSW